MADHRRSLKRREPNREKERFSQAAGFFENGKQAHRSGELGVACEWYRKVLKLQPRHADALHLLGFAEFQSSNFEAAVDHLRSAVSQAPENGEFHNNLALAYLATGDIAGARKHAAAACELRYRDGQAYVHVGWTHYQFRRFEWAEQAYRLALDVDDQCADACHLLGVLYAERRRWHEAIELLHRAIELQPDSIEALTNLGNAYRDQGRLSESIPFYKRSIALNPGFAAAHNNLGIAYFRLGQLANAIECYEAALALDPRMDAALSNRGNAFRDLGRLDEAISDFERALQLNPRSAEIRCNLGVALRQQGKLLESIEHFRRGAVLLPQSATVLQHLASALTDVGRTEEASRCLRHISWFDNRKQLWELRASATCPNVFDSETHLESFKQQLLSQLTSLQEQPFDLTTADLLDVAPMCPFAIQFLDGDLKEIKRAFAKVFVDRLRELHDFDWTESWKGPGARPRLGCVVTDGHEEIFLRSLSGILQRTSEKWEWIVFCSHRSVAKVQAGIQRSNLSVVPTPTRIDRAAQVIAETRCDLLYYWEVGTDVYNYFLPFFRLAPIQITSWGIQVTSGVPALDVYVSNELVEPSSAQDHYTETLVLAKTLLTYRQRTTSTSPIPGRDAFQIPADLHWYACPQQLGKFHVDFDKYLAEILREDPRGALVIAADRFGFDAKKLRHRFQQVMPDVTHRIFFLPRLGRNEYLSLLWHADVLLDPPHFGGVNTTYDALSLGKPIVVHPSEFHRGRYSYGCYRKMDLLDCVASDFASYVKLAVTIGTDSGFRHDLSRRIQEASEILFEDSQAVCEHERIFEELLERRAMSAQSFRA